MRGAVCRQPFPDKMSTMVGREQPGGRVFRSRRGSRERVCSVIEAGAPYITSTGNSPVPTAWPVKTRRVQSRHCRNAGVFSQTTTVMHNMSAPPASPPFQPRLMPHILASGQYDNPDGSIEGPYDIGRQHTLPRKHTTGEGHGLRTLSKKTFSRTTEATKIA